MDKYTRFHIPVRVDMQIVLSACDTAAYELRIVLEIHCEDLLSSLHATNLTHSVIHIFSLLIARQQIERGVISNRHIVEIPGKTTSLFDQHVKEFI